MLPPEIKEARAGTRELKYLRPDIESTGVIFEL
jgi:hypothetical protein